MTSIQNNPASAGNSSVTSGRVDSLWDFSSKVLQSVRVLRYVGYGLLLMAILDLGETVIPPQFMNPSWEFQTMGTLVERVPVPLIGLALVFFGENSGRSKRAKIILRVLSWLSLLVAALFFLLVPIGVLNTVRIDEQTQQRLDIQLSQGIEELQTVNSQLEEASTVDELSTLLAALSGGEVPVIETSQDLQAARTGLETAIIDGEASLQRDASNALAAQRRSLLKRSVKWNLGAIISGALFFTIWKGTGWARR
ncbi:MAG: HpsJ family protein [Cyanobacteria bacterium P01_D01_bin.1]